MKNRIKTILVAVALTGWVGFSHATPTLTLDDGNGHVITASDAGGVIVISGAVGDWVVNVSTAIGSPPSSSLGGTITQPHLDLNSVNVYGGTGGAGSVLTITFTDDLLGPIGGSVKNSVGGTLSILSDTFQVLVNGSPVTTQTFATSPFSGTANAAVSSAYPTTLGIRAILHGTGGGITSFDDEVTVPDGGLTIALLGFALVGVESARRKLTR